MPVAVDIALTHLFHRRRQSIVSVLGVALGVGFFIAVSGLMQGSQKDFMETLIESQPHITIRDEIREAPEQPVERLFAGGAVNLRSVKPREEVRGIRNYKVMVEAIRAMDSAAVSPVLVGNVILRYGSEDRAVSLRGIEPAYESHVTNIEEDMVAGSLSALQTNSFGVVMGRSLADRLGIDLGDTVTAVSPVGTVFKVKIVGLFHSGVPLQDLGLLYALLRDTQVMMGKPHTANVIGVKLSDPEAAPDVAAEVESRFGYKAESWQEANEDLLAVFIVRNVILYAIVSAITVVAGFGIFNVISTVVLEKRRDIAILMSMGFREGDIRRIFVVEGALIGIAGAVIGWGVGFGLLEVMGTVEFKVESIVELQRIPLDKGFYQYLIGATFAVAAAVLAAYMPARKAAALRPVDIIRGAA